MRALELGAKGVANHYWPDAEIVYEIEPGMEPVDVMLAIHILQTQRTQEVYDTLTYWRDLIKPGGQLMIMVPDLVWAAKIIAQREDIDSHLMAALYGTPDKPHQCGFSLPMLRAALSATGYQAREAHTGPYMIKVGEGMMQGQQLYVNAVRTSEEEDLRVEPEEEE